MKNHIVSPHSQRPRQAVVSLRIRAAWAVVVGSVPHAVGSVEGRISVAWLPSCTEGGEPMLERKGGQGPSKVAYLDQQR